MLDANGSLINARGLTVDDLKKRSVAAALIRRLAVGEITNDDFENDWPAGVAGRGGLRIKQELWTYYSDLYTHTLTNSHALDDEGKRLFERCATFMESNTAYKWPRIRRTPIPKIRLPLLILSLGLLLPINLFIKGFNKREDQKIKGSGDITAWPFLSHEEYEKARANCA